MSPSRLSELNGVLLLALGAMWGSAFLLIKVALQAFPPIEIVSIRLLVGAGMLLAVTLIAGARLPRRPRSWAIILLLAVTTNVLPFSLISWAEQETTSSVAAILNATAPLFTIVGSALLLRDRSHSFLRYAGILLAFLGVGIVVGMDTSRSGVVGDLALLAAAVCYAAGFLIARSLTEDGHAGIALAASQLLVAATIALPLGGVQAAVHAPRLRAASVVAVIALGLWSTGAAYVVYYWLLRRVGSVTTSMATYLVPLVGVLLGSIFLQERLGWNTLIGGLTVICGIALAESRWQTRGTQVPELSR